jgi:hypothetical protein
MFVPHHSISQNGHPTVQSVPDVHWKEMKRLDLSTVWMIKYCGKIEKRFTMIDRCNSSRMYVRITRSEVKIKGET